MSLDIALISIPRGDIAAPPIGIASLKGVLNNNGFTSKCYDFNIDLYNSISFEDWLELDDYFQSDLRYTGTSQTGAGNKEISFINIIKNKKNTLKCQETYKKFIKTKIQDLLKTSPKIIGLSVFSVNSVMSSIDFLQEIKKQSPNQKILAGGMGLSSFGLGGKPNFGEFLLSEQLIDSYISGEGEKSIIDYMKDQTQTKILSEQITDLDSLPFPDYTDFDFSKYQGSENMVYITGSRGCVRACTFCDINSLWKKFKYRSGANIGQEILEGHQKYGTLDFYFTDSLINGNLKEFISLLDYIIDLKKQGILPENLMFGGQFIARPKNRFPEEYYQKMQEAGVYNISIGIESGSDKILKEMRKGVTNNDYDFMMEMLSKYGIRLNMLMLIGYPTETRQDFEDTLNLIERYKKYSDDGTIWGIVLGKTMVILPQTPIADSINILYDHNGNWTHTENTELDYDERVRRRLEAGKLCEDLGYVIKSQVVTVNSLHKIVLSGGYDSIG